MPEAGNPDVPFPVAEVSDDPDWLPPEISTGTAHSARVHGCWAGGKDHFAADRELGDSIIKAMPSTVSMARANRAFLGRAVRYLAGQAGTRPEEITRVTEATRHAGVTFAPRSQAGVAAFFDGLEVVDQGVVPVLAWRPGGEPPAGPRAGCSYAAAGRKP